MENSLFLAKIFGAIYAVVGLGMLLNGNCYRSMIREYMQSAALLYLGGLLAFAAGLFIVLLHNVWVLSWPVMITLFGWAALIKGFLLLVFPSVLMRQMNFWEKFLPFGGVFALVVGGYLLFVGFFG